MRLDSTPAANARPEPFDVVVLHIGLHKTGTTTIQQLLYRNREELLAAQGVLYPSLLPNHSRPMFAAFSNSPERYLQNVKAGITTTAAAERYREQALGQIEKEFRDASAHQRCRRVILSGEDMSMLGPTEWRRLKTWLSPWAHSVEVVCVVREPVAWARSNAQSMLRGGRTLSEINASPPLPDVRRKLTNVMDTFGHDRVHVYSFEELLTRPQGLVTSLAVALGIEETWLTGKAAPTRNRSMSLEAAWIISALNESRPLVTEGSLGEGRSALDVKEIIDKTEGRAFDLAPQALEMVARATRSDVQWLTDVFDLTFPPAELDGVDEATGRFSEESIRSIALQLAEKAQIRQNNRRLSRRVKAQAANIKRLQSQVEARANELARIRASRSWRITAPLRILSTRIRRRGKSA